MAFYRTGTASMTAAGVVTGNGTKWKENLTLIRPGATMVFLTSPLKLAVVSAVVSDTEIKAIQTDGEAVDESNYVILLNDSLTVDGLAQDVAETLRYYQSKETVIEEAIEFFKNFDLKGLQDLVNQIKDAAQQTEALRAETEQLKNETNQIKSDTDAIKQQTQGIKDSAVSETNAIKQQTQSIKDSAVTETNSIKQEAFDARDAAEEHMMAAQSAQSSAESAQAGAVTARNEAEEFAKSLDANNLLKKDANLSDLKDKNAARVNLSVDRIEQFDKVTYIFDPSKKYALQVSDSGAWGCYEVGTGWKPLPVANGGTGATSAEEARNNLECLHRKASTLTTEDLNSLGGTKAGFYYQGASANATRERHYPIELAGSLVVMQSFANSPDGCTQLYYPYNGNNKYYSRYYTSSGDVLAWSAWKEWVSPNNDDGFRSYIGLGANSTVTFGGITAKGTYGIYADGLNFATGATIFSRYFDGSGVLKGQGEFRANVNGAVELINRSPNLTGGQSALFWNFDNAGRFWSPSGITTSTGANWNDANGVVNRGLFISGSNGAPKAGTDYAGIHVGFGNVNTFQMAARLDEYFVRTSENNSYVPWRKLVVANPDVINFASGTLTADNYTTMGAISYINGTTDKGLPNTYGILASFGNGDHSGSGCYVGQLCWAKDGTGVFTRARNDGAKAWTPWLKFTTAAVSDEKLKDIKGNLNVEGALDNINRMEFKLFRYLKDSPERSTRRGVIAQQIRWIDREYTTKVGDQLHLDTHPMLMDGLAAIQALTKRDEDNKQRISKLEGEVLDLKNEIAELKALISNIAGTPSTLPVDNLP